MLLPLFFPILFALLFLILYKRPVNASSVHSAGNVPIEPATPKAVQPGAIEVAPVAPAAPVEVSMNFNDIFAPKKPPTDRPNV